MLTYKVIELSTVTEETIQDALNEQTSQGWRYDVIQFAMRDASRRPAMAFILFTRDDAGESTPS
jgi:precorrin-6B methylase 2